jgi:hypothetical protein
MINRMLTLPLTAKRRNNKCKKNLTIDENNQYCWDLYREGQISALDRVQKKAAKFAHNPNSPIWENLASRRKLSRICALYKAYSGERAWKPIVTD